MATTGSLVVVARAATTAALPAATYTSTVNPHTLIANGNGALAVQDGTTMAVGDILFVKDQAAGLQNGTYKITDLGGAGSTWKLARSRSPRLGQEVRVLTGTLQIGGSWRVSNTSAITVGTTAVTYAPNGAWQSIADFSGTLGASQIAGTFAMNISGAALTSTSTVTAVGSLGLLHLDPTNYQGAEQFRVVGMMINGSVAQTGVAYFFGIYPITAWSAANPGIPTLGSVLGETATMTAPAAQSTNVAYGPATLLPTSATPYLVAVRQTGTGALSSLPSFRAFVQVRG